MTGRRGDEPDTDVTEGSGEGGPLGTPSGDADERPPSQDQEVHTVVSGGGVADPTDESEASTSGD